MTKHVLKCWPTSFHALKRGDKTFEIRKDDRGGYDVGDVLELHEFEPTSEYYTGEVLEKSVTHLLKPTEDEFFGLKMGYVIMSVR